MAEINIDRIGGSGGTPLPLGNLKVDNPLKPHTSNRKGHGWQCIGTI
jgi:hypothetical protein